MPANKERNINTSCRHRSMRIHSIVAVDGCTICCSLIAYSFDFVLHSEKTANPIWRVGYGRMYCFSIGSWMHLHFAYTADSRERKCHIAMFFSCRRSLISIHGFIRSSFTIFKLIYSHSIDSSRYCWNAAWNNLAIEWIFVHLYENQNLGVVWKDGWE